MFEDKLNAHSASVNEVHSKMGKVVEETSAAVSTKVAEVEKALKGQLETTHTASVSEVAKVAAKLEDSVKAWNTAKVEIMKELGRKADSWVVEKLPTANSVASEIGHVQQMIEHVQANQVTKEAFDTVVQKVDETEMLAKVTPELVGRLERIDRVLRLVVTNKADREEMLDAIHNINLTVHVPPSDSEDSSAARVKCLMCSRSAGPLFEPKAKLWTSFPPSQPRSPNTSRPVSAGPTRRTNTAGPGGVGTGGGTKKMAQQRLQEYYSMLDRSLTNGSGEGTSSEFGPPAITFPADVSNGSVDFSRLSPRGPSGTSSRASPQSRFITESLPHLPRVSSH